MSVYPDCETTHIHLRSDRGTSVEPYQSVIIIAEIQPARIVIVALVYNVRVPEIRHTKMVAKTHDGKLSNIVSVIMPNKFNNKIELCTCSGYTGT